MKTLSLQNRKYRKGSNVATESNEIRVLEEVAKQIKSFFQTAIGWWIYIFIYNFTIMYVHIFYIKTCKKVSSRTF